MPSEIKRVRVDIRMTVKEKKLLKELARDRGLTLSEYVRERLMGREMTVRIGEIK